jgi:hypothetical protein
MIYLASPYSHPNKKVEYQRFLDVTRIAAKRLRMGEVIFSPIMHGHPAVEHAGYAGDAESWQFHNINMLRRSDRLMIATLDGWRESKGVRWEVASAIAMKIPRIYLEPNGDIDFGTFGEDPLKFEATL